MNKRAAQSLSRMPYALAALITFSVLLFGSVEPWAEAVIGTLVLVLFNWMSFKELKEIRAGEFSKFPAWKKLLLISIAGFLFLSLIQVIPLPLFFLKFFSPSKYELLNGLGLKGKSAISIYPHESLNELARFLVYLMAFGIAYKTGRQRENARKMLFSLVVFGFLLSMFAFVQKATWDGKIYWIREVRVAGAVFGPFVNRNHFAGFVGMLIPAGLGLGFDMRQGGRTEKAALFLLCSLVMWLALFYSLSRGGIISFMASMLVFFSFMLRRRAGVSKRAFYEILCVMALAILFSAFSFFTPAAERFAAEGVSDGGRFLIWNGALSAFRDFWPLGCGIGNFRHIFPVYNPGIQMACNYAHNDYLQLLVETGIAGGICIVLFMASIGLMACRIFTSGRASYLLWGLSASISYMGVHSFFDFNLHIPSNALTFAVILGLFIPVVQEEIKNG
jgi:O-antigen ligase